MTQLADRPEATDTFDPIEIELLHMRVLSVTDEAGKTIYRTAISPVITEGSDYSATLLGPDGDLVAGSGAVSLHWLSATRAARAIIAKFGDQIDPGDVFFANDPYDGGGVHPSDVFVTRPIFVAGARVGWVVASAHMIDIGGVALGSWAPAAAECYAEAFRMPPVRMFRKGTEITDVFDVIRANVRMPDIVEMDLRSLVAASFVADEKLQDIVEEIGIPRYLAGLEALRKLSHDELRRRLALLPNGTYRSVSWTQWGDQLLEVPCVLTIADGRLVFDLEGAAAQVPFFVNTQPFILMSMFLSMFCPQFIPDLPFNSGVPGCFEVRCPEATIVNARRPAPVGAGHVHVAMNVSEIMLQCVRLAVAAATEAPFPTARVQGWNGISGIALSSWGGVGLDGKPDGWMFLEGTLTGSPGGWGRDGVDAHHFVVPTQGVDADGVPPKSADIEIMESWHPILITGRKIRTGSGGAGRWRAGSGLEIQFELQGTTRLIGQMIGLRPRVPIEGVAGGLPGDRSEFVRIDADGTSESIRLDAADVVVGEGQSFIIRAASGGGVGDPLDRPVEVVAEDVRNGILTTADALDAYGVLLHSSGSPDNEASVARRDQVRRQRLARATPPAIPVDPSRTGGSSGQLAQPLYPGIAQRGPVAFAEESGAPLAVAPDHWTDGCPVLEEFVPGDGPAVVVRSYLDPISGRLLHVEAVPHGVGRAFDVLPERWTAATG